MHQNKIKVYVIGPQTGYARPILNSVLVSKMSDADIVVLTGGADVDPRSYGKKDLASYGDYARDQYEIAAYEKIRQDQLVMGTCRGAQLLTVLNGGNLIQDVTDHGIWGTHGMIDKDGNLFQITSLHHQMCYPFDIDPAYYDLLMVSEFNRSKHYIGDGIDVSKILEHGEPELIAYHSPGHPISVAIQGHPEMMENDCDTVKMFNEVLIKYLNMAKRNG